MSLKNRIWVCSVRFLWLSSVAHTPRTKPSPFQSKQALANSSLASKGCRELRQLCTLQKADTGNSSEGHAWALSIFCPPRLSGEGSALYKRPHKGKTVATSPIGSTVQTDIQFYQKTFSLGLWQLRDFSGFPSENRKQLVIALPRMVFLVILGLSEAISASLILFFVGNNCDKVEYITYVLQPFWPPPAECKSNTCEAFP